jgi:type 1 glutamine amidotransferase
MRFASFCAVGVLALSLLSVVEAGEAKPIRALLVIGGCCHDYAKQKDILKQGLEARARVEVTISYDPDKGTKHLNPVYENPEWFKGFDVVIHDECCSEVKDTDIVNRILEPHRQGLPAVLLHCGMHSYRGAGYPKSTQWFEFTGVPSNAHGPQEPIAITFVDKTSPITKGLENWTTIKEELYNNINGGPLPSVQPLARGLQITRGKDGKETKNDYVVAWTNTYNGKTRVFGTTLGHNNATVEDSRYLDLVTRGLLWSVGKLDSAYLKSSK